MQLMNMPELMEFLKVKRSTIYKLREEGLPTIHLGRVVRFDREEIIRWLRSRQRSDPAPRSLEAPMLSSSQEEEEEFIL